VLAGLATGERIYPAELRKAAEIRVR
jgi:hypothetical protein